MEWWRQILPEVHKQPIMRMRSKNVGKNGRKCD